MRTRRVILAVALVLGSSLGPAFAASATWSENPQSDDWNTSINWTPGGPPDGSGDVATFQASTRNNPVLTASAMVNCITFELAEGSFSYLITAGPGCSLTINGAGIINDSGRVQQFAAAGDNGLLRFMADTSAGVDTSFTTRGGAASGQAGGVTEFRDNSTAGQATFTTNSGTFAGALGGVTQFFGHASAAQGSFITDGRTVSNAGSGVTLFFDQTSAGSANFATLGGTVEDASGGYLIFYDDSTADHGDFHNYGGDPFASDGGFTQFFNNASAGDGVFANHPGDFAGGRIQFFNNSTAGHGVFTLEGGVVGHRVQGGLEFLDNSSAANGTFVLNGSRAVGAGGGVLQFSPNATADTGTFTVNGSVVGRGGGFLVLAGTAAEANFTVNSSTDSDGFGGVVQLNNNASAANASFVINGVSNDATADTIGGPPGSINARASVFFTDAATAADATLTANGGVNGGIGGSIGFGMASTGGLARIKLSGNAVLAVYGHTGSLTIGSLEGNGTVFLGSTDLAVGSNNLSTIFAGVLQDGDERPGGGGGIGGSLAKLGTGTLTLTGSSTYTGPTTISDGRLILNGSLTSNVIVNSGGTFGGSGTVHGTLTNSGDLAFVLGGYGAGAEYDRLVVNGGVSLGGRLNLSLANGFRPGVGDVFQFLVADSVEGTFATITTVGFTGQVNYNAGSISVTVTTVPDIPLNISTRLRVQTGDNVLIGGFIVTGTEAKRVILRALGPSLSGLGVPEALADPTLELHAGNGTVVATNDDWKETQQAELEATGLAPTNDFESAIVSTLDPGAYTTIVRGKNNATGVGLVEAYDLAPAAKSQLGNMSTRGFVNAGDNVMIGGFIIGGHGGAEGKVIVRALGPSLTPLGVPMALEDPTLELHNGDGAILAANDDWRDDQQTEIEVTGLAPTNEQESAIIATLPDGGYTAIVRGKNNGIGVGLVEVYNLQQ